MDIENRYGALDNQIKLLEMMKDIHRFFTNHHIVYSLAGGNLLGAVRENGFIPWDDDCDIVMDRDNFEKFLSVKDEIDGYVAVRMLWEYRIQRKEDYDGTLTGSTIDIVVMDKVPRSRIKQSFKLLVVRFLQGAMKRHKCYHDKKHSFPERVSLFVTYYVGKLFSDETKFKWYDKVSQIGRNDEAVNLEMYDTLFKYLPRKFVINLMDKMIMHPYEDTEFPITAEYDNYLRNIYGDDYMTPPPIEERVPQHS